MKRFNFFHARTSRRILLWGAVAGCSLLDGMPAAQAQDLAPGAAVCGPARENATGDTRRSEPGSAAAMRLEDLLAEKPGVWVRPSDGAPGASFATIVRGLKSFRGQAEPLYIVDGVILNPTVQDAASAFRDDKSDYQATQNALASIAPGDIERIEVLRDASATALYGAQGANGVIVITTRTGRTQGERIDYRTNVGIAAAGHMPRMLSPDEYRAMLRTTAPQAAAGATPVDWMDETTRTALVHSHYASAEGARERMRHFLSLGYDAQQGVIRRTGTNTLRARVNLERTIRRASLIGMRSNFGHTRTDMTQATAPLGAMSTLRAMRQGAPLRPASPADAAGDTAEGWLAAYDDRASEYFIQQTVYLKAALAEGLSLDVTAGIDYRGKERKRWVGSGVERGAAEQGRAAKTDSRLLDYNATATLAYERLLGERHRLTARLGAVFDGKSRTNYLNEGYRFFKEELRADGIQLAENIRPAYLIRTRSQQAGLYAAVRYTLDERYAIDAGLRGDYTFRYDNRFDDTAFYPWVSASWDMAREAFLANGGSLSTLRLRGGWGRSGSQAFDPYLLREPYTTGVDPQIEPENGIANYYDLRWTVVVDEWNVGVDVGVLGDRIRLEATWYDAKSRDRLRYYRHGRTGAWEPIYANSARVANRGVELALQSRIVEGKAWRWSLDAAFACNRNRIIETGAPGNGDVFGNPVGVWNGNAVTVNVNRPGHGVGAFYGYESQGIVDQRHLLFAPPFEGERLQPGDVKLVDRNGDCNVTAEDRGVIGDPNPSFVYSLSTRLEWRNLSLTLTADGAADFDIMDLDLLREATLRTGNTANLRRDSYRKAYPAGAAPRLDARGADVVSSRFVEDGSYLRLANIRVAYRFDIGKRWLRSLELAFTARNLCTLTGYSGNSPLVNSYGYDLSRYGVDNSSYPQARTFLLGVHATF